MDTVKVSGQAQVLILGIVDVVPRSIKATRLHIRSSRQLVPKVPPGQVGPDLSSMLPRIHTQLEQTGPRSCAVVMAGHARPSELADGQGKHTHTHEAEGVGQGWATRGAG